MAPNCSIMPLKITFGVSQPTDIADAITFAVDNGASIISNSWGFFGSEDIPNLHASIVVAIEDAISNNIPVVFSGSNTAHHYYGEDGGVNFPANSEVPGLITVGASTRHDLQANYSPTDTEIDLVAPSHTAYHYPLTGEAQNIWTIDIPDTFGLNTWNRPFTGLLPPNEEPLPQIGEELPDLGTHNLSYTGRMGGTSASTPMVAGIIALMRSVNPCLNVAQVNDILKNTSEKVGGYDYNWNTEDPGHAMEMGHGRVNAHLAVVAAQDLANPGMDLYTKDTPTDFGAEPNTASELLYVSEDIWVRNQPDGIENQIHENPEYNAAAPVYVYVRVRNKGCEASLGSEELKLYWAKASTALTWPQYWDGTITSPALMGDQIGFVTLPSIPSGQDEIILFEWQPPNPADYEAINDEPWHFCLLSRIVAPNDPMNNEIANETWNLGQNVRQNNNIAWKNLSVVDIIPGIVGGGWDDDKVVGATIAVGNATNTVDTFNFDFKVPEFLFGDPVTRTAEVRITLDDSTWQKWAEGGYQRHNIEIFRADRRQLIVKKANARLSNLRYDPHERSLIHLSFNFLTREISDKYKFEYHVLQRKTSGKFLGGEKYVITFPPRQAFVADAGDDVDILLTDSVLVNASEIAEPAIYNWYDADGIFISTGRDLTVAPEFTQEYKVEIIAESDGFKDYDEVEVRVNRGIIQGITPNPASTTASIQYNIPTGTSAELMLTNVNNGNTQYFTLNINATSIVLDVSTYAFGIYGITLVVDGQMVDHESLVIE